MKILVLNCGSSSLKYRLVDVLVQTTILKGNIEGVVDHNKAIAELLLTLGEHANDIVAIGHRVVHGGESFREPTIATEEVLSAVEGISDFAPLHNPANIMGVWACLAAMPNVPNVLVFDTAFHSTIEPQAFMYAIPNDDYKKYGVRRYGFHGTSYSYVSKRAAEELKKPLEELRLVVLHVGNGASACAIKYGKSVDTSMGLTPLEGLVMGTRSGDIDAGAVAYLARKKNMSTDEVLGYLNTQCGLRGLCGENDMRKLLARRESCAETQNAIDVFVHRIVKYVGAFAAVMGGVDAVVWTGGIGENQPHIRDSVMARVAFLGARTLVIETNEELEISLLTKQKVSDIIKHYGST